MKNKFVKKLRSRKGFSLTEMLVATLILGLMSIGLATGVRASLQVYQQSVTYSEERVLLSTLSDAVIAELRYAKDIGTAGGKVYYASDKYGVRMTLSDTRDNLNEDKQSFITINGVTQDGTLQEGKNLVGTGAYSTGSMKLSATIDPLQYNNGVFTTKIYVTAPMGTEQTREISVRPIDQQSAN